MLLGDVEFTQNLIAPMGENILLELHGIQLSDTSCTNGDGIEVWNINNINAIQFIFEIHVVITENGIFHLVFLNKVTD